MNHIAKTATSLEKFEKIAATKNHYKIIKFIITNMALYTTCKVFKAKYGANVNCKYGEEYYAEASDSTTYFEPKKHEIEDMEYFEHPSFIHLFDKKTGDVKREIVISDLLEQMADTHKILKY